MKSFTMARNGGGGGIGNSRKMYKARKITASQNLCLISSSVWNIISPVLVAVFISISIVNCVSAEESPLTPTPVIQPNPSPGENSNGGNANPPTIIQPAIPKSSLGSRCNPPKFENGKETVRCTSYTTIPTDIPDSHNVKVLDMSAGNAIQTLTKGQLYRSNLTALSVLILRKCQIRSIEEGAFNGGPIGPILDLDLSHNLIEVLDPQGFVGLTSLRTLNLNNNPINRFVAGSVFPPLQNLITLNLEKCKLDDVPINVMSNLQEIRTINLRGNDLARLDWRVFRNTKKLNVVQLAENPWHCDCHVKFLMDFLENNGLATSFQSATCASTSKLVTTSIQAKWADVPHNEMTCNPKIEKMQYDVLQRANTGAPTENEDNESAHDDKRKVNLGDDVYFECEYTGYPSPHITWLKDDQRVTESPNNSQKYEMRTNEQKSANNTVINGDSVLSSTLSPQVKPKIEFQDVTVEITRTLNEDEEKNNYRFRKHLIVRRVRAQDSGVYTCIIENVGGRAEEIALLNVTVPQGLVIGALLPGGKRGLAVWMWILMALLCVLILVLMVLVTCLIWRRREKRKQEVFRKVVHEKFKDSNIDLGDLSVKASSPSKDSSHIDGATPLLDNRSESSTIPITDNHLQQKVHPLPDIAVGNAILVRNSAIFSPKPPPALHGYGDARKEFFARQISEPYLRPASAMSLSGPGAMNAEQRRYIFANQPYQSEPVHGEVENLYAVPVQYVRDFPRSGSAMSVSAVPEYDLRRQMFLRQPQSQYATAARLPHRRIPSTSSEPPFEYTPSAFNYSTLPRRPVSRSQNWSRPVSPTNSTCSNYSTLSWRPNMDPRTGVISDGMGQRNTAHGGSSTSINKVPDMNGKIIGEGNGIESMNRAMLTPSSGGGAKVKSARNPRYGHSRTPSSLTRGHNDFFSFEPIQEVESSEYASTQNLDRTGGRQTPTGYTTQSLARGDPRYKRKKPPPISMIPANLKTPSRAFEHLKGRSISPALRNSVVNADQPKEQVAAAITPVVSNTNNTTSNITVPVLESPIDEEAKSSTKTSAKVHPPPPPPKPKRQSPSEEDQINGNVTPDTIINDNEANNANSVSDGTVV